MTELEQRVLRHRGQPAATVAIAEGLLLGEVQHIRRCHGRGPDDGLEPLERPVDELGADDWAMAYALQHRPVPVTVVVRAAGQVPTGIAAWRLPAALTTTP